MEHGVVRVEDSGRVGELGRVPVVMGGENSRLGLRVHPDDESLDRLIGGKRQDQMRKTVEKDREEKKQYW